MHTPQHALQQSMMRREDAPHVGSESTEDGQTIHMLHEEFVYHIAWLRVLEIWFHHAHWSTKGETYYGDHLMFERIYREVSGLIDQLAEKGVAMAGVKVVDTHTFSRLLAEILCSYPSPSRANEPTMIAATGLALVNDYLETLDETYKKVKASGAMTMGLDDLLMSYANKIEGFVYLLKRRVQTSISDQSSISER